MRARLILILLVLVGIPMLLAAAPVARGFASSAQQRMVLDRLQDATRLASTAQQTVTGVDEDDLRDQMVRYSQAYGITVGLVDRDGTVLVHEGGLSLGATEVRARVEEALQGHTPQVSGVIWPWNHRPLIVAVPVLRGDDVVAAVVTVSQTDTLRSDVMATLLAFGAAYVVLLAIAAYGVARLAGWALRPVYQLDAAAGQMAGGSLGIRLEDVTGPAELRHLADSFNVMAARVSRVLRAQSEFVADASHQLKTPLATITLRLGNLEASVGECGREELSEIFEEVARLRRILDALIRLANASEGETSRHPTDIADLVDRRLAAWRAQATAYGIALESGLDEIGYPGARTITDEALFGSALDAVIDNALKFSRPPAKVTVSVLTKRGRIEVVVRDQGPGLAPAELSRIGDRFWRSPGHRDIEGTGLGVSFVRSVLEALGGDVGFTASSPAGLTVTLGLPAPGDPLAGAGFTPFPHARGGPGGPADPGDPRGTSQEPEKPQGKLNVIGGPWDLK